jgi:hypothetical protein
MPIEELIALVPPPECPVGAVGDWASATFLLDAELPADFRELIRRYGSGRFFDGHLEVFNPLTLGGQGRVKMLLEMCAGWGLPFVIHPKQPGVLPWGRDENGNSYCWLTKGKPARWPVLYLASRQEHEPQRFAIDVPGFLARLASNEYRLMEQPFAEEERTFTPSSTTAR